MSASASQAEYEEIGGDGGDNGDGDDQGMDKDIIKWTYKILLVIHDIAKENNNLKQYRRDNFLVVLFVTIKNIWTH